MRNDNHTPFPLVADHTHFAARSEFGVPAIPTSGAPPLDDDDPPELPLDPELLDGGMDADGEDGDDGELAEGQPESSGSSRPTASSSL